MVIDDIVSAEEDLEVGEKPEDGVRAFDRESRAGALAARLSAAWFDLGPRMPCSSSRFAGIGAEEGTVYGETVVAMRSWGLLDALELCG